MLLFSSSHARFTQIQIKVNRLKTSWALGAVLRANTTEPLLQAEQCSHNGVTASSFSAALPEKSAFRENQTKPTPPTLLVDPSSSPWHWSQLPSGRTVAILHGTPWARYAPSLLLQLPLGAGKRCRAQPCTQQAGNPLPGVIYSAALLGICFHISMQQIDNWFYLQHKNECE